MNLEEIKDNYKRLDDFTLERIAYEDSNSLSPEVLDILKVEIKSRNLDSDLETIINTQPDKLSSEEFDDYINIVRNYQCPICNISDRKLNAAVIGEVKSMILISSYEKKLKIACSDCLDKLNSKANKKTALLGWWSIPMGPFNTLACIYFNLGMENDPENPSKIFNGFVLKHIGVIEASKKSPEKLSELLRRTNR